jgi:hypothetical protein
VRQHLSIVNKRRQRLRRSVVDRTTLAVVRADALLALEVLLDGAGRAHVIEL